MATVTRQVHRLKPLTKESKAIFTNVPMWVCVLLLGEHCNGRQVWQAKLLPQEPPALQVLAHMPQVHTQDTRLDTLQLAAVKHLLRQPALVALRDAAT